jgi:hypothetical protein
MAIYAIRMQFDYKACDEFIVIHKSVTMMVTDFE